MTQYTNIAAVPNNGTWTNIGTGPATVQLASPVPVQIIASDTQPTGSQGYGLAANGVSPTQLQIQQSTTIWAYVQATAPTASQVVVHATPGAPVYDAYQGAVAVTWNSATAANTTQAFNTAGMDTVALTIQPNGTITAGAITFEVYDGANWIAVKCARMTSYNTDSTFNLAGASLQGWTVPCAGYPQFRVRLSTAITGTGNALITNIVSSAPDTSIVTAGLDPLQAMHPGVLTLQAEQVVAVGATSAQSAVVQANTNRVVLVSTTGCWVAIGTNPTAVAGAAGNIYVPPNIPMPAIAVASGSSKIAVIQASAAGSLSIIETL